MAATPLNFTPSLTGGSSGGAAAEGTFRSGATVQGGSLLWPALAAVVGVVIFLAVAGRKK